MRIGQNGPLEKFSRFLFMHLNVACITNIWRDNIYADTNLCNRRLTHIIRINKTRAEKCCFTIPTNAPVNGMPHYPPPVQNQGVFTGEAGPRVGHLIFPCTVT